MRYRTTFIGTMGLLAALTAADARAAAVQPGDTAPDFTLSDAGGTSRTLSDFRGQLVLLWFFGYG